MCKTFTYDLFPAPQHTQFSKPNVEWRAAVGPIGLFHDDNVDCSGEGGGVDFIIEILEVVKETAETDHICDPEIVENTRALTRPTQRKFPVN